MMIREFDDDDFWLKELSNDSLIDEVWDLDFAKEVLLHDIEQKLISPKTAAKVEAYLVLKELSS